MLKVRSDAKFSYGHSKTVSGNAEVTATFSQKRWSYLGAATQALLHIAFSAVARYTQTSFLYITACEPSFGGYLFFGENDSNISVKFLEKFGKLWGGLAPDDPRRYPNLNPPIAGLHHS